MSTKTFIVHVEGRIHIISFFVKASQKIAGKLANIVGSTQNIPLNIFIEYYLRV